MSAEQAFDWLIYFLLIYLRSTGAALGEADESYIAGHLKAAFEAVEQAVTAVSIYLPSGDETTEADGQS